MGLQLLALAAVHALRAACEEDEKIEFTTLKH